MNGNGVDLHDVSTKVIGLGINLSFVDIKFEPLDKDQYEDIKNMPPQKNL